MKEHRQLTEAVERNQWHAHEQISKTLKVTINSRGNKQESKFNNLYHLNKTEQYSQNKTKIHKHHGPKCM